MWLREVFRKYIKIHTEGRNTLVSSIKIHKMYTGSLYVSVIHIKSKADEC